MRPARVRLRAGDSRPVRVTFERDASRAPATPELHVDVTAATACFQGVTTGSGVASSTRSVSPDVASVSRSDGAV